MPHPAFRLCHNGKNATFCHSERSEESDLSMSYANEILRLTPQNDIVTQPRRQESIWTPAFAGVTTRYCKIRSKTIMPKNRYFFIYSFSIAFSASCPPNYIKSCAFPDVSVGTPLRFRKMLGTHSLRSAQADPALRLGHIRRAQCKQSWRCGCGRHKPGRDRYHNPCALLKRFGPESCALRQIPALPCSSRLVRMLISHSPELINSCVMDLSDKSV